MVFDPHPPRATTLALILCLAAILPAQTLPASAEPGDVKGQDVMGDKSKSAQDGWSQAPVPREESAGKDTPDPGGASMSSKAGAPGSKDSNADASGMNNGADDPQKPLDHRTPGPSGSNPAAPSR